MEDHREKNKGDTAVVERPRQVRRSVITWDPAASITEQEDERLYRRVRQRMNRMPARGRISGKSRARKRSIVR